MKRLNKQQKGQHLVEFAIIIPILMILLLIIIEFGYAVYVRGILAEGTKRSLIKANQIYNIVGDDSAKLEQIKAQIRQDIDDYLYNNNIPYSGGTVVDVSNVSGTNIAIVTAKYVYYPSFVLPEIFGGSVIPKEVVVSSSQVISSALLQANSYNSYLNTNQLSSFANSTPIVGTGSENTQFIAP